MILCLLLVRFYLFEIMPFISAGHALTLCAACEILLICDLAVYPCWPCFDIVCVAREILLI